MIAYLIDPTVQNRNQASQEVQGNEQPKNPKQQWQQPET